MIGQRSRFLWKRLFGQAMSSEDPRDREYMCGEELVVKGQDESTLLETYDPDTWYSAENGAHYCCREVWFGSDDGRCIWHADVPDKPLEELLEAVSGEPQRLDQAVLRNVKFPVGISFSECRLIDSDLQGATFREADFDNAIFQDADLSGADLREADISGADLREADLSSSILWETNLDGSDLREADLEECSLYLTTFGEAIIDDSTTFGTWSGHEIRADVAAENFTIRLVKLLRSLVGPTHVPELPEKGETQHTTIQRPRRELDIGKRLASRLRAFGRPFTQPDQLEKAEVQYRTVQRLNRENDLKQNPDLELREKHVRRKRALAERRYGDWLKLAFYRWPMGYGEQPSHVVATSVAVIFTAMLAYPHAGGFESTSGSVTLEATLSQSLAVPEAITSTLGPWLTSFYFSVVTFTTVGYGDLQPATEMGRLLASVESFLGALLMALLVFVLGRRATW